MIKVVVMTAFFCLGAYKAINVHIILLCIATKKQLQASDSRIIIAKGRLDSLVLHSFIENIDFSLF